MKLTKEHQADLAFYLIWSIGSLVWVYLTNEPKFYITTGWGAARIYTILTEELL